MKKIRLFLLMLFFLSEVVMAIALPSFFNQSRVLGAGNVVIKIPSAIMVQAIDGKEFATPSFVDGFYTLRIPEGKSALQLQYYQNWNTIDDVSNIIRSVPVEVGYEFTAGAYSVSFIQPQSVEQAEAMASNPKIWIEKVGGETVAQAKVGVKAQPEYYFSKAGNAQTLQSQPAKMQNRENDELRAKVDELQMQVNQLLKEREQPSASDSEPSSSASLADWQKYQKSNATTGARSEYERFKEFQEFKRYQEWLKASENNKK